jgi:hypothetical protein
MLPWVSVINVLYFRLYNEIRDEIRGFWDDFAKLKARDLVLRPRALKSKEQ